MLMEQARGTRSLRAPQGDGQTLVEPPLESLPQVLAANRQQLARVDYDFQGRSLSDLSLSARRALVEEAANYTRQYRNVPDRFRDVRVARPESAKGVAADEFATPVEDSGRATRIVPLAEKPFILAGHQPQLFHPGVWYKNFVLGSLADQLDAMPVHLLIDSDLCRGASIRVPTGAIEQPRLEAVPFDGPAAELPYEERAIEDLEIFRGFGKRVASLLRPLVAEPLVKSLWPLTLERNPRQTNLGLRLAQGRHALEETWHNDTLELPQSAVCRLPEFNWFLAHVLAHLPRFWAAHNDALAAYRRLHHLRNRAHPVPDLAEFDGWLEAPFWIWTSDDPRRRPLFAQQTGDELLIADRQSQTVRLSISSDGDAARAVEQLLELSSRGVKIRTRALTTTLFARLVLSDLFLHGIGGAKYDQVTDQIARTFFGFEPPQFAAVSATLRLPIASQSLEPGNDRSCAEQLRALRYHPERFISTAAVDGPTDSTVMQDLLDAKRRWIAVPKTRQNARERHVGITTANESLQPNLRGVRRAIKSRCTELQQRKRASSILQSREFSFCLFPREHFETLLET
jgi:hypothetical protein